MNKDYEIRDKPCECNDRALKDCPGKWEKGCDLGTNEKFVGVSKQKSIRKVKLLAYLTSTGLEWRKEWISAPDYWEHVPSEDKEIEVEES